MRLCINPSDMSISPPILCDVRSMAAARASLLLPRRPEARKAAPPHVHRDLSTEQGWKLNYHPINSTQKHVFPVRHRVAVLSGTIEVMQNERQGQGTPDSRGPDLNCSCPVSAKTSGGTLTAKKLDPMVS